MSEDEQLVFTVNMCLSVWFLGRWFWLWMRKIPVIHKSTFFIPFIEAILLFVVLFFFASQDVRTSPIYITFYMFMGISWLFVASRMLSVVGYHIHYDLLHARNPAAERVIGGAFTALMLCFAGGNIGDGPGWWVVVFAALLSTLTFYFLIFITEILAAHNESIIVDRDQATSLRVAFYYVALGLILGRGVAGNWISPEKTLEDFFNMAWPVVFLVIFEVLIARIAKPSPQKAQLEMYTWGWLPGMFYIILTAIYLIKMGWWA